MSFPRIFAITTLLLSSTPALAQPDANAPPTEPPAEPAVEPPVETPAPEATPAPTPEPAPEAPGIDWKYDKGLTAETTDKAFEMKIGIRSQTRLEMTKVDGGPGGWQDRFFITRLRLQMEGHAYGEDNVYKFEFDAGNKGFAVLKDFFVERAFDKAIRLRLGQWKKPFNRQELTSDFAQAFNERSLIGKFAGSGRDIGLMLHSGFEKSPDGIEWALGVFNGTGDAPAIAVSCNPADPTKCTAGLPSNAPADFVPEIVARVGFNQGGIKGYSELDLEGGPLRFGVGAAYKARLVQPRGSETLGQAAEIDGIVKVEGFNLSVGAFLVKPNGKEGTDTDLGGYGQAGYVAIPKTLAVSARFGMTPAASQSDEWIQEILGAINLMAGQGHNYKLVLDGGVIKTTGVDTNDLVIRAQGQFVF